MAARKIVKLKHQRRTKKVCERDKLDMEYAQTALRMGIDKYIEMSTTCIENSYREHFDTVERLYREELETLERVAAKAKELQCRAKSPSIVVAFKKGVK